MKKTLWQKLSAWYKGDYDFTLKTTDHVDPQIIHEYTGKEHTLQAVVRKERAFSGALYNVLCVLFCLILIGVLLGAVVSLPPHGNAENPAVNEVMERYVEEGMQETGAVNTVAGMILDYRAFDTLGESFVLFTAVCAVTILMKNTKRTAPDGTPLPMVVAPGIVDYSKDNIVKTVSRFLIPFIFVFGIYVLLNGHLSPGGGFSGCAILGSALILFSMVYGENRAAAIFSERLIKTVVLVSLSFYAIAKSYSFFTGANHLHSIISQGIPGRILSAGLILPLNVAVGFVVCCTMYSFYMYFRRGRIQ